MTAKPKSKLMTEPSQRKIDAGVIRREYWATPENHNKLIYTGSSFIFDMVMTITALLTIVVLLQLTKPEKKHDIELNDVYYTALKGKYKPTTQVYYYHVIDVDNEHIKYDIVLDGKFLGIGFNKPKRFLKNKRLYKSGVVL